MCFTRSKKGLCLNIDVAEESFRKISAALSKLSVTTKRASEEIGHVLNFDTTEYDIQGGSSESGLFFSFRENRCISASTGRKVKDKSL